MVFIGMVQNNTCMCYDGRTTRVWSTRAEQHVYVLRGQNNTCMVYEGRTTRVCATRAEQHVYVLRGQNNTCMCYEGRTTRVWSTRAEQHVYGLRGQNNTCMVYEGRTTTRVWSTPAKYPHCTMMRPQGAFIPNSMIRSTGWEPRINTLARSLRGWMDGPGAKGDAIPALSHKCVTRTAPVYLCDCLQLYTLSRTLCSASDTLSFQIPRTRPSTGGSRAFSVFGPSTCNDLPLLLRQKPSLDSFK